ncbi:MAG: AAA family ATPase [Clostridia bacterium]|nr:AAA family ATPase [Clostridia bacterium]
MKTLAIMIGLQGSGKSEFCRRFLTPDYVHISLDELHTRNKEALAIEACIRAGQSMVIDNTNPTRAERQRYIALAKENGYRVVGYFVESKLRSCIARNNLRTGKARIPAKAIAATSNKLEIPQYEEGFDALYFVHNENNEMYAEAWKR